MERRLVLSEVALRFEFEVDFGEIDPKELVTPVATIAEVPEIIRARTSAHSH